MIRIRRSFHISIDRCQHVGFQMQKEFVDRSPKLIFHQGNVSKFWHKTRKEQPLP